MALTSFNSIGGFAVGENQNTVIDDTGNITTALVSTPLIQQNGAYNVSLGISAAAGILQVDIDGNSTQFLPESQIRLPPQGRIMSGTYDRSSLLLDTTEVQLSQLQDGNVLIQTGGNGNIENTWNFSGDGSLTAPGNVTAQLFDSTYVNTGIANASTLNVTRIWATNQVSCAGNVIGNNLVGTSMTIGAAIVANTSATLSNIYISDQLIMGLSLDADIEIEPNGNGNVVLTSNLLPLSSGLILGSSSNIWDTIYTGANGVILVGSNGNPTTSIVNDFGNLSVTTSLSVTGDISVGGNIDGFYALNVHNGLYTYGEVSAQADITTTANIVGNCILGNGAFLTGLPAGYSNADVAAYLPTYTGNIGVGNVNATGVLYANTFASPNGNLVILSNLNVQGNVTYIESNVVTINDVAITLANNATSAAEANGGGFIINGANSSFTFDAVSNAFISTQGISSPYFVGDGANLSNINGGNVIGVVASATTATSANTADTVTVSNQPNITSVGTLTSINTSGDVSAVGNITSGNLIIPSSSNLFLGNTAFTRTLTVGSRTGPVTVAMTTNNSFNVPLANGGNAVVYTT